MYSRKYPGFMELINMKKFDKFLLESFVVVDVSQKILSVYSQHDN